MHEIERKYLVDHELWNKLLKPQPKLISQGYILNSKEKTVRVRTKDEKAFLTIKGAQRGITRVEFEYEIPLAEAKILLDQFAEKILKKNRYEIEFQDHTWEVDVFQGKLDGLILAEIELMRENESFPLPPWITTEVTYDPNYLNANLINSL